MILIHISGASDGMAKSGAPFTSSSDSFLILRKSIPELARHTDRVVLLTYKLIHIFRDDAYLPVQPMPVCMGMYVQDNRE